MLAFIDISGDPYAKPKASPWIAIHTICIKKRSVYDITATLYRHKRDVLANEYIEIKSTDFINKSTLNHPHLEKTKFIENIISQCIDHSDCRHGSVVFKNSGANQKSDSNRLPKHYIDILWRIEAIARKWNEKDVIVVIDNNARKVDRNLAFAFNNYIYRSSGGNQLSHILPVPIFADSETTAGLQLADISAGIMRKFYHNSLDTLKCDDQTSIFLEKLREYCAIIKSRSVDSRIGTFVINGIYNPSGEYYI